MQNTSFYIFRWYFFLPFLSLLLVSFSGHSQAAKSDSISAFPIDTVSFFVVKTELPGFPNKADTEAIYTFVEDMPKIFGCDQIKGTEVDKNACTQDRLRHFFATYLIYPKPAFRAEIEGRIPVNFIVEKDGSISHLHIERDIGGGCKQEAIRLLKLLQACCQFTPQRSRRRPVRIKFRTEIVFSLKH